MFLIRFLFISKILFLIFLNYSFSYYKNNQRFLIESSENNKNEDGSVKINLLRMEVNKIEDEFSTYKIGILYEIDGKNEDYVYTSSSSYPNDCSSSDETTHKIKSKINGNKGKKLILVEDVFWYSEIARINICLKEYNDDDSEIDRMVKIRCFFIDTV